MEKKKERAWFFGVLLMTMASLLFISIMMGYFDPYFHFHGPIAGLSYRLTEERYINHGIVKNFEYDALITGSSMNQNFKTSTMDRLFGTASIKVPFSGAGFEEVEANIRAAMKSGNEIKYVLWGLDYNGLYRDHDWQGYDDYPEYLYDDNPFNDVSYIFNKNILLEGLFNNIVHTITGQETTSFDEYSSWDVGSGWEQISHTYRRSREILPEVIFTEEDQEKVVQNIEKNIVQLAKDFPDTQFILFYTPYSALYWESLFRDGVLKRQLMVEKTATELLLTCDNIKLFNFNQMTEITTDVTYYRDKEHYIDEINEMILHWIVEGKGLVTKENYQKGIEWTRDYYENFDYDTLYTGYEQYMIPEE